MACINFDFFIDELNQLDTSKEAKTVFLAFLCRWQGSRLYIPKKDTVKKYRERRIINIIATGLDRRACVLAIALQFGVSHKTAYIWYYRVKGWTK
jgi:hypothetical protein